MPFVAPDTIIPISVLLIPLIIFLIFYLVYSFFNVYHLLRFGVYGFGLYMITTLYAAGTILLMAISIYFLLGYDWTQPIMFGGLVTGNEESLFGL